MNESPTIEPSDAQSPDAPAPMVLIAYIRFRHGGRVYRYDAGSVPLRAGDRVLVQGERGTSLGTVASPVQAIDVRYIKSGLPRVIKKADHRDLAREEANIRRALDAQRICLHRVHEHGLQLKLIKTDCSLDGSKITFHFFAEDRIDFRELVRDLAQTLHTRIEMKQVGPRDETRVIGGIGSCGRELCCSSFLREFSAVSVKMAKAQGLSLNPSKLAGMCGRLKCCLRYEYDTYLELGRNLPNIGTKVESVKGNGVVTRQNILRQTVLLQRSDDGTEVEASLEDLVTKKGGQGRAVPPVS